MEVLLVHTRDLTTGFSGPIVIVMRFPHEMSCTALAIERKPYRANVKGDKSVQEWAYDDTVCGQLHDEKGVQRKRLKELV